MYGSGGGWDTLGCDLTDTMLSLAALLSFLGAVSALHQTYIQPHALTISSQPHFSLQPAHAYTAPVQVYTAAAAPVYAAVPATPQYHTPAHTYSSHQYAAPASTYTAPRYTPPVKSSFAPHYSVNYQAPAVKYQQAPAVHYQAHAANQYASSAYSSQYVRPVAILRQAQDDNFDGSFSYDFQAENGISSGASGYVKSIGPNEEAQVIQGQYSYTAPDGTPITTRWYADETGFHAEGAHLPVSPPVPEAIAKSLAYQGISAY